MAEQEPIEKDEAQEAETYCLERPRSEAVYWVSRIERMETRNCPDRWEQRCLLFVLSVVELLPKLMPVVGGVGEELGAVQPRDEF